MPAAIHAVLARLGQDLAACLATEAIADACREEKYRWRDRVLDPVDTVGFGLIQVLQRNTACRHLVHFGGSTFSASAYASGCRWLCSSGSLRRSPPGHAGLRLLRTTLASGNANQSGSLAAALQRGAHPERTAQPARSAGNWREYRRRGRWRVALSSE